MERQKQYTLVPMQMEAVMIPDQDKQKYANINPNFNSMKMDPSGASIEAEPFTLRISPEAAGIHIHWILPEETAHGIQEEESGTIRYPPIPNRYLITRLAEISKNAAGMRRKTWIVESDSITGKRNDRNRNSTTVPVQDDLKQTYRFLGECREFAGEITEGAQHLEPLHACVAGNPCYASYYPMCRNVLGFHDDLQDIKDAADIQHPSRITYVVTGWYAGESEGGFPDHVYHGLLHGLVWKGSRADYPSGIPVLDHIAKISIGSSTEQAMAALVAFHQKNGAIGDMVESLMENSLQDWGRMDGIVEAEYRMHENGFGTAGAERITDIRRADKEENGTFEESPNPETSGAPDGQNRLLWCIQSWQMAGYEIAVEKGRLQQEIADLWRSYTQSASIDIQKKAQTEITARAQRLYKLVQCCQNIQVHTARKQKKLKGYLGPQMQERAGQRFYIMNDPAAVLEGAGKNSLPDGGDSMDREGHFRTDREILDKKGQKSAQELLKPLFTKDFSEIPRQADQRTREILDIAQRLVGEALLDRQMPYGRVYTADWNPLILEWELEFYPDSELAKEQYSLKNWTLEGLDFVYKQKLPDFAYKEVYRGRTMLSTHASRLFRQAGERFLKVQAGTYLVKNMPYQVLSQVLSGFRENLVMRRQDLQYPPQAFSGLDAQLTKLAAQCTQGADTLTADYDRKFYPVLAGFLRFTAFHVIDTFGRVQAFEPAGVITPAKYRTVKTERYTYLAVPPRLTQPARIFFQWRDAKTGAPCLDMEETSPICGWIWPNFAESSLLVYAGEGTMLGSISTVYDLDTGRPVTVWRNAPGNHYLEDGYPQDMPSILRHIADGILEHAKKEPELLYHILRMLDESFWDMHCTDAAEQDAGCAMLGYPIAVALAGVALQTQGKLLQEPLSLFETDRSHASLELTEFPLRFGNPIQKKDGAIGFYDLGEDAPFDRLHVCGVKDGGTYGTQGGYLNGRADISIRISERISAKRDIRRLLFLLNPFGKLHMFSGILPVKKVGLPRLLVSRAMKRIYYTLYCAPVLSPVSGLAMPFPHMEQRKWTYLEREIDGHWRETADIQPAEDTAFAQPAPYAFAEGWLKQQPDGQQEEKEEILHDGSGTDTCGRDKQDDPGGQFQSVQAGPYECV